MKLKATIDTARGTATGLPAGYRVVRNGPGDVTIRAVWWRRVLNALSRQRRA